MPEGATTSDTRALKRLRERREAAGLSQAKLADKVGVNASYIGLLERGERLPSLDVLLSMCEAVGLTASELFAESRPLPAKESAEIIQLRALLDSWPPEHLKVLVRVTKELDKLRCTLPCRSLTGALCGAQETMALDSYPRLYALASEAARRPKQHRPTAAFFKALAPAVRAEQRRKRSRGDRHALVGCIRAGMAAMIAEIQAQDPRVEVVSHPVDVFGLRKSADYALKRGRRLYLIEQKSILRFNEFAELIFEAMIFKSHEHQHDVKFAGLFHYLHQDREAFESLRAFGGKTWVDHICVLIPGREYERYSSEEVRALHDDISSWLRISSPKRGRGRKGVGS